MIQGVNCSVDQLKFAIPSETSESKVIRLLYELWLATENRATLSNNVHKSIPSKKIRKVEFVNFVKHFKDLGETQLTEIYFNLTKKL